MEHREEYVRKSRLMERFREQLNASKKGSLAAAYYTACLDIIDTEEGVFFKEDEHGKSFRGSIDN